MKTRKADGQILVIILLVLSILSIFILSMVTNARRDSQESRDNQKYEQFYSIGEQQLILAQQATGLNQLSASKLQTSLASVYNISDIQCIDLVPNVAAGETSTIQCSLPEASYETG